MSAAISFDADLLRRLMEEGEVSTLDFEVSADDLGTYIIDLEAREVILTEKMDLILIYPLSTENPEPIVTLHRGRLPGLMGSEVKWPSISDESVENADWEEWTVQVIEDIVAEAAYLATIPTLSRQAQAVIAGLIWEPTTEEGEGNVFARDEVWEEVRRAFPLETFTRALDSEGQIA